MIMLCSMAIPALAQSFISLKFTEKRSSEVLDSKTKDPNSPYTINQV